MRFPYFLADVTGRFTSRFREIAIFTLYQSNYIIKINHSCQVNIQSFHRSGWDRFFGRCLTFAGRCGFFRSMSREELEKILTVPLIAKPKKGWRLGSWIKKSPT